jgi:hypothetical protein
MLRKNNNLVIDMTGKCLKEFERLNTTVRSIYNLEDNKVFIVLEDATNLTDWEDVNFPMIPYT